MIQPILFEHDTLKHTLFKVTVSETKLLKLLMHIYFFINCTLEC